MMLKRRGDALERLLTHLFEVETLKPRCEIERRLSDRTRRPVECLPSLKKVLECACASCEVPSARILVLRILLLKAQSVLHLKDLSSLFQVQVFIVLSMPCSQFKGLRINLSKVRSCRRIRLL